MRDEGLRVCRSVSPCVAVLCLSGLPLSRQTAAGWMRTGERIGTTSPTRAAFRRSPRRALPLLTLGWLTGLRMGTIRSCFRGARHRQDRQGGLAAGQEAVSNVCSRSS